MSLGLLTVLGVMSVPLGERLFRVSFNLRRLFLRKHKRALQPFTHFKSFR